MSSTDDAVSDVYELIGNLEPGAVLDRDELKRLELFRSVESSLFEPILRGCPVQSLGPGEVLITAGQPNEYLYLVLSGRLSIHLDAPDGSVVATLAAGAFHLAPAHLPLIVSILGGGALILGGLWMRRIW